MGPNILHFQLVPPGDSAEGTLKIQLQSICVYVLSRFSCVRQFVTLWTIAHQAPLSMGFSRQEYWSGLPCPPPPGEFPDPGIKSTSLMIPALSGRFFTTSITWEAPRTVNKRSVNRVDQEREENTLQLQGH